MNWIVILYLIGIIVSFFAIIITVYNSSSEKEITVKDLIFSIVMSFWSWIFIGVALIIWLFSLIDYDKVIYKGKK